jgi:hypothetical protein
MFTTIAHRNFPTDKSVYRDDSSFAWWAVKEIWKIKSEKKVNTTNLMSSEYLGLLNKTLEMLPEKTKIGERKIDERINRNINEVVKT